MTFRPVLAQDRTASVRTYGESGVNFQRTLRSPCLHARNRPVFLDQIHRFGLHPQVKARIPASLLLDEVEEIPLRHQPEELAVCRKVSKVANHDLFRPYLRCQLANLLMRALQKFVQNSQLIHDLQRRRMDLSPRKSRRKSPCFSSTWTSTPARASRKPSIIPAGPPPAMQTLVVIGFMPSNQASSRPQNHVT